MYSQTGFISSAGLSQLSLKEVGCFTAIGNSADGVFGLQQRPQELHPSWPSTPATATVSHT